MTDKPEQAIEPLSFEQALQELEKIVRSLETGQIKLEDSVKAYEKGMALKKQCEEKLKNAKLRIDQISLNQKGDVELKPFEESERS